MYIMYISLEITTISLRNLAVVPHPIEEVAHVCRSLLRCLGNVARREPRFTRDPNGCEDRLTLAGSANIRDVANPQPLPRRRVLAHCMLGFGEVTTDDVELGIGTSADGLEHHQRVCRCRVARRSHDLVKWVAAGGWLPGVLNQEHADTELDGDPLQQGRVFIVHCVGILLCALRCRSDALVGV